MIGQEISARKITWSEVGSTIKGELKKLLAVNEFCRAEDLLFAKMDSSDDEYLAVALDFYDRLNELTDDVLEEYNFPREEILSGVQSLAAKYGLEIKD